MPPIMEPATASWGLRISNADLEKLKLGFTPQAMEDRWCISAAEQSQIGSISVTISRSWTDREFYVLDLKGGSSGSGAKIESITWEQKQGETGRFSEEEAKEETVDLIRCFLECDLEALGDNASDSMDS